MALFQFQCPKCNKIIKKLFKTESSITEVKCPDDQNITNRLQGDISTLTYEVIDNGIMVKKVTRLHGAPQMLDEREAQDRERKKKNEL